MLMSRFPLPLSLSLFCRPLRRSSFFLLPPPFPLFLSPSFERSFSSSSSPSSSSRREVVECDVLIVGGGPAGLSAAIRLAQRSRRLSSPSSPSSERERRVERGEKGEEEGKMRIVVVEKGGEVGSHIVSGNVVETSSLEALFPSSSPSSKWDHLSSPPPLHTPVRKDELSWLYSSTSSLALPVPPSLNNRNNYICSLGALSAWLSQQAEELGVQIFSGFSAAEVLYEEVKEDENNETQSKAKAIGELAQSQSNKRKVVGVATRDVGVSKTGKEKVNFARGIELRAKQTLFAEGARGSCSEELMKTFDLRRDCDVQTYGLGFKEVWEIQPEHHQGGLVQHTIGWPAPNDVWFGSFLYHLDRDDPLSQSTCRVFLGAVVGLDYTNPHLSPYHLFQQWKTHPSIAKLLKNGRCISYGARVINEGGLQSVPKLIFPGGALIGCAAGFLNVPKIKGTHTAMWSGIEAADALIDRCLVTVNGNEQTLDMSRLENVSIDAYEQNLRKSWVFDELRAVRNYHPSFQYGLYGFMAYSALSAWLFRGKEPWTFRNHKSDMEKTLPASKAPQITYPKPDGVLTFDLLTNVARTNVWHEEDQPCHLRIKQGMEHVPVQVSYAVYDAPETRFCPAKVYEYVPIENAAPGQPSVRLQINQSNCIHCKACDIKTPQNYILWTVPEGGSGPGYSASM